MTPEQIAAQQAAAAAAKQAEDEAAKKAAEDAAKNSPDPLKEEAERVKKEKEGKTELEKALYTRNQIDKRIKELQGDTEVPEVPEDADDNAPVTVGMLKKLEQDKAAKTALTLAEEQIKDSTELELVKHHLENSVKPSGNAVADLQKARAIVNETKNRMIAEEATRRQDPNRYSKGTGGPGPAPEGVFTPTAEESMYMRPPFNVKKDQIIAARKLVAQLQK